MFEKEENTVQIKSNNSPIHISYNMIWFEIFVSGRQLRHRKRYSTKKRVLEKGKSKESEHCNAVSYDRILAKRL